uniref:Enolase-phosphatase E1 n=1 Tax=Globodera pallida TaxID=36090 RepID=A0A183BTJ9_GLOPA
MRPQFDALLTDIEGTTTSIDFVKNVLFPYAANYALEFLQRIIDHSTSEKSDRFRQLIVDLINTSNESADPQIVKVSSGNDLGSKLAANVQQWIQQDKKVAPSHYVEFLVFQLIALKKLQGFIWEDGYRNGSLKAHVYSDVPGAFQKLSELNVPIYIFSSGSVHAQQLLFSHTSYGDLTRFISGYFDTTTGPKFEGASYLSIVEQIGLPASKVMFLTDDEKEAMSADEAGLQVRVFMREGNAPLSEKAKNKFKTVNSLAEIYE